MDAETQAEIDKLKMRNFEMLGMQLIASARLNALKELAEILLEVKGIHLHETDSFQEVFSRMEKEKMEEVLSAYSDDNPDLAAAMKQWIEEAMD
ncbi:MAG TPA: hypothetical protein VGM64_13995 [Lacunisphaera sp.]|jgi:hypothetical protein